MPTRAVTARSADPTGTSTSGPAPVPTLRLERRYWQAGDRLVCGIDEVGRGAWAGPVTVGAVVPPPQHLRGVRDSKLLRPDQRERVAAAVADWAVGWAVGHASAQECDELGMTAALRLAAGRALRHLEAGGLRPDRIILDGNHDYLRLPGRVVTRVGADATSLAVAAASVVAKVARDRIMTGEAEHFPAFGFETNRGYPTLRHRSALAAWGPTTIHRRSWIYMDGLCWGGLPPAPGRLL